MLINNDEIKLYPSNWLYNAGVVGFLKCLDRNDYLNSYNNSQRYNMEVNVIHLNKDIFEFINVPENYFKNGKVVNLAGKNQYYPNFLAAAGTQNDLFKTYINRLSHDLYENNCSLCYDGKYIPDADNDEKLKEFFLKIENFDRYHNILLGPSGKFPNAYWNNNSKTKICHLCAFIIIHQHLAFTKLADGSEIFINAPSFKVMYELNKIVKEMFGKETTGNQKREILAMSVIEYARRVQTTLGQWAAMNIEIVMKSGNIIDFYILPYETIQLISDRKIAALLSDIGEFSILNAVLDGKEKELLDLAYHFIQISFKGEKNKGDQKFINDFLKRYKNKIRLNSTAQKILNLYATIKERRNVYARQ